MKERPILFSGEMVRAILEGRKTQTRRLVKNPPAYSELYETARRELHMGFEIQWFNEGASLPFNYWQCPYGGIGSRLWVRETFSTTLTKAIPGFGDGRDIRYTSFRANEGSTPIPGQTWKPSIFMPRDLSRITLEITAVRVERLQEITDADALAEGVDRTNTSIPGYAKERFRRLWDQINGKRASWQSNPWVWVVEFKKFPT